MRTRVSHIFVIALSPVFLCAQQKYVPGYIVTTAGDTLKGEIKINEKKPLDRYVKAPFRDTKGMQKTYKPEKIKGYGFGSDNFVTRQDGSEPAFFRVLTDGHIDLLELKYEGLRMNKPVVESEYYLAVEGEKNMQQVKSRNFRKQLGSVMNDNEEIASQYPEDKQFEEEEALSVINAYNAWKAGQNTQ